MPTKFMRTISKDDVLYNAEQTLADIKKGEIFIYPTDTIYGIGCNALNDLAVKKIRRLKGRPKTPFSVIAPSKEWIKENCVVNGKAEKWLKKLPGPYTLVFKLKKTNTLPSSVHPKGATIGVRMPGHWIQQMIEKLGFPVITTSANKAGMDFMTSIDDLDIDIKANVPIIIYEGEKEGKPSQVVDLSGEKEMVVRK